MDIEQVLPHVLERVDTRPIGPRGVAMLELLYLRQAGRPNPVILGRKEIARLTGRSLDQAKYDTKALERVRGLGMVRRCPGRGRMARAWSLNEPRYWRVRWLGRRDQIIAYFAGLEQGDLISLWGDHAGQRLRLRGDDLPNPAGLWGGPSVTDRPTTESDRPTTESAERDPGRSSPHKIAESTAGTLLHEVLKRTSSSLEAPAEEEERSADTVQAAAELGKMVAERIGKKRLWGRALAPIEDTVARYPGRLADLRALVAVVAGAESPEAAALIFADEAARLAAAGWAPAEMVRSDVGTAIRSLKQRIANLEAFAPDDDHLPLLRDQLADLERLAAAS